MADLDHLVDALPCLFTVQSPKSCSKVEVGTGGHVRVEGDGLREVACFLSSLERIFTHIEVCNPNLTLFRHEIAGDGTHGGCLSCTIGADKTNDFTLSYCKADVIDRQAVPVELGEIFNPYHLPFFCSVFIL